MSLTPQTLFNTRIGIQVNQNVITSGSLFNGEYRIYLPGQYDGYIQTTEMFYISPQDLADLDDTVITHHDRETGIKKTLFSLGGGIDFCVSVYVVTQTIAGVLYKSVECAGCLKYNGQYIYTTPGLSTAGGIGAGVYAFYNPVNIVKQYGIKLFIYTDYASGQGESIINITEAVSFGITAYIPGLSTENLAGFQSWSHMHEDEIYFRSRIDDPDMSDWVYNPQYIYYGYEYNQTTTSGGVLVSTNLESFYNELKQINPNISDPFVVVNPPNPDPSQEEDPSGPGGGGGNMDPSSDPIPFPDLPTGGALLSGAIKAFEVTPTAMTQMFLKLWDTSIFDIATFQKLVEAPLDSLIQLQCVPMDPHTSGTAHIMLGNFDTEAVANVIDQEYYTIDCGTLAVEEYWGSALDYSPYTSAEIWVPMVGFRDLDINDIMGKTIHLKYNYSIFDGNLTAQLMCGNAVLYKWPGNVKETIPVTAKVSDALQRIVSGAMGVATAGSGAGMAAAAIGAAVNVAMSKTHVSRTGEMSGSTGLLDDFMPFLIIHRPIQSLAAGFKSQKGYPSNISSILSACSGYTEVEYIHLTGISGATDTELEEIEQLLKNGVII